MSEPVKASQEITCISCPVGCRITATLQSGEVVSVQGNQCRLGDVYARQECVCPRRMVTAVVPVEGSPIPVSLKTEQPIPRDRIWACMQAIRCLKPTLPIRAGQVLLKNAAGTGVNLIATKSLEGRR